MLETLGFNTMGFESSLTNAAGLIGRITRQDRQRYTVITGLGTLRATLTTGQRFSRGKVLTPIVGDWVTLLEPSTSDGLHPIKSILPRRSQLSRRAAGDANQEQVLVANPDIVFVVSGLDQNFNVNRIERFLAVAWSCGLPAVLILSKADLCNDLDDRLTRVQSIVHGTPIYPVNMHDPKTLTGVLSHLSSGLCAALMGSSGVGKSTLLNQLLGSEHMATQPVRAFDDKGRHTTTHRELCLLPNDQGLVIDTPGMREAQIWFQEAPFQKRYGELFLTRDQCRFSDCRHLDDPGCAVRDDAMADPERRDLWQQYRRLMALKNTQ